MTTGARVRNFQSLGRRGRYEFKCVATNHHIRDGRLDLRHMAGDALIAGAAGFMVSVFFDRPSARPVG